MKETLLLFLIIFAFNAVPAWLKKRKMKTEGTKEQPQRTEPEESKDASGAPPSLQDLIRKFNERQKEFKPDGDDSAGADSEDDEHGGSDSREEADENPDDDKSEEIDTAKRIPDAYRRAEAEAAKRPSPVEAQRDVHGTHSADALREESSLIEAHRKAELARKEAEVEAAAKLAKAEAEKAAAAEIGAKVPEHLRPVPSAAPNAALRNFKLDVQEARRGFLWAKVIDDPRFRRRNPFQRVRCPR